MTTGWLLILCLLFSPLVLGQDEEKKDRIDICNTCQDGKLTNAVGVLHVPGSRAGIDRNEDPNAPDKGKGADSKGADAPAAAKGADAPAAAKGADAAGKDAAAAGAAGKDAAGAGAAGAASKDVTAAAGKDVTGAAGAGGGDCVGGGVDKPFYDPPLYGQKIIESDYKGEWVIDNPNCGVNAMQLQLMPNNKLIWIDTTNLGPSALELGPKGNCPLNPDNNNEPDCFAHGVQYDAETGEVVPLYVKTDPWCSSGHLLPNGDLMSTGGNRLGFRSVRLLSMTDPEPKFAENEQALVHPRWYPSNVVLDIPGYALVVGGREQYNYDIVPPALEFQQKWAQLPFLEETREPGPTPGTFVENNLYPFLFLLPDGNIFLFANDRAISFFPPCGAIVKQYPPLEGGSRNYPPSGQAALLPLRLSPDNKGFVTEIVICGGNKKDAFQNVDPKFTQNRVFTPALSDCNRIEPMVENPVWEKEQDMPSPRTMGDLLILPNGQLLFINGAKKGTSGWGDAEDPNLTPTLYMPENEKGERFKELTPTDIPRMYHSSSAVLPDGKVLVAGSNPHEFYTFDGPYPTELRVEKFSPPYLDPKLAKDRPVIKEDATDKVLKYGQEFKVTFTVESNNNLGYGDVVLSLYYPPFTTHGFSQNQRLLIDGVLTIEKNVITAKAPESGRLAPQGYYLMFVNHRNIPSKGMWVHID